jgi:hypothetical protein
MGVVGLLVMRMWFSTRSRVLSKTWRIDSLMRRAPVVLMADCFPGAGLQV